MTGDNDDNRNHHFTKCDNTIICSPFGKGVQGTLPRRQRWQQTVIKHPPPTQVLRPIGEQCQRNQPHCPEQTASVRSLTTAVRKRYSSYVVSAGLSIISRWALFDIFLITLLQIVVHGFAEYFLIAFWTEYRAIISADPVWGSVVEEGEE